MLPEIEVFKVHSLAPVSVPLNARFTNSQGGTAVHTAKHQWMRIRGLGDRMPKLGQSAAI
jgi:hypothetical protein